ncbi:MAG: class I adenylate-forming enzyme family protein [Beijerinckiaceae bacterium]
MQRSELGSLWEAVSGGLERSDPTLWGADANVALRHLARGSGLGAPVEELQGRSVLVKTEDQLAAALALIELDGTARRLVLCPSDLAFEHVRSVAAAAEVDVFVTDRLAAEAEAAGVERLVTCNPVITPASGERTCRCQTEWVLLTSGTTGTPKLVQHTLSSLTGAITAGAASDGPVVWSTFYDIRRYGGLQILLRALLGSASIVLSSRREATADFLIRAGARGVTHISGTPSHWRRALMSPAARRIAPRYARLSGEIADQAILDQLRAFYPAANVAHAFASTEAGLAFAVDDRLAGFPARLIERRTANVEMKIEDGSLRIRSPLTAKRYLGGKSEPLVGQDGFVDTGDLVERRDDRYYFVGRKGGIINVGGLKVHPEEVEAVINHHPRVQMSLVRARKSPITGALVVADIVLKSEPEDQPAATETDTLKREILEACHAALAMHKVPASIRFVSRLDIDASGKLARRNA